LIADSFNRVDGERIEDKSLNDPPPVENHRRW
jgi:hypothetical protein